MATTRQKRTTRRKLGTARTVPSRRAQGTKPGRRSSGLSTAEKNRLPATKFAFPKERKEPLVDARHVRNAVARFDQVAGVSDAERDQAWRRIRAAARKFGVKINERGWRQLVEGGKAKKK
jgi:hypothetical protein